MHGLFSNEGSKEPRWQLPLDGGLLACPVVGAWHATVPGAQAQRPSGAGEQRELTPVESSGTP